MDKHKSIKLQTCLFCSIFRCTATEKTTLNGAVIRSVLVDFNENPSKMF